MSYLSKNPISIVLKAVMTIINSLISSLKYCFNIKKMLTVLLFLTGMYIVVIPILKFINKLFNKKHNNSSCSSSSNSHFNKRKFRNITSESSCSACKHNESSSKSSKSSKSKSKSSSSSSSTHIDKRKVENVLRKFKITV